MNPRFNLPCILVAATLAGAGYVAIAQAPAWWTNRNVIATNAVPNDFAPINQGQVKWLATQAALELDDDLQHIGGAGPGIETLIASFSPTNNYLPVNLGQLKNVAKPFYDRLWELALTNCYPSGVVGRYPWSSPIRPPNDYAMANIGQAKYAFSFDTAVDSDGDGIPDIGECDIGSDPYFDDASDVSAHPWAYNLTNLQVYQNPSVLNADGYSTLNDGVPDWWKIAYGFSVTTPASTVGSNGHTLAENYENDTDPNTEAVIEITLVGESQSLIKTKGGFETYQTTDPSKMYLKQVLAWSDLIGGNPESGPLDVGSGTETTEFDPATDDFTTSQTGCGYARDIPSPSSPTYASGTVEVSSYDDPPNEEYDEPGSQTVTATLSEEYTTDLLKQYTAEQCPAFTGDFSDWDTEAVLDLSSNELHCTVQKLQYKFQFNPSASNMTLNWCDVFTPKDDPNTSENESTNKVYTARTWTGSGSETPIRTIDPYQLDPSKYGTYSVIRVGMTAYRPTTEGPAYNNPFQRREVPEAQEETPGAGIRVNGDTESGANENDLIEVELKAEPYPTPSGLTYVLKRQNSNIKVWDSQTMGTAILDSGTEATITFSAETKTVWVENPSGGSADLEFIARSGTTDICSDKVHFYPFTSIVIALGGEGQDPTDPANANHGTFQLAIDLYEQGYDVHMYNEDSVAI